MELAIDTVGPASSVAVSDHGRPLVEIDWPTGRRHTPSLIPTIDYACHLAKVDCADLTAVFVDVGPGAYGGIRAGMAAAMGLAAALDLQAVGVGRLEIEAYAHAAGGGAIAALHAAGRAQWALALYRGPTDGWVELAPPRLLSRHDLLAELGGLDHPGVLTGEVDALGDDDRLALRTVGWRIAGAAAGMRRAAVLAEIGWARLSAGGDFSPARLEALYLREPAIGPQPPVPQEQVSQKEER